MGDDGPRRQAAFQSNVMDGVLHPAAQQHRVLCDERRTVVEETQELDGAGWLEPVAVLSLLIARKNVLAVGKVKAPDAKRGNGGVDRTRAAGESEEDIGGDVIALLYGQMEQLAQRDVYIGVGLFTLQRTVGFGQNTVFRAEADRLVEAEAALLDRHQDCDAKRQLEH